MLVEQLLKIRILTYATFSLTILLVSPLAVHAQNNLTESQRYAIINKELADQETSLEISDSNQSFSWPKVMPGENQQIEISGSTVHIKGITDLENTIYVNGYEISIQKDGSFGLELIIPLGETEVKVTVIDPNGNAKSYAKTIEAKENHFFLVGIADATINIVQDSAGGNFWERDGQSFKEGTKLDGKLSYYMVGKVKGKYLIKSALDTDKETQKRLFSNIDPDDYYPIYGDNSTVVYDVNSQNMFYLLVEWDRSGFVIGNYQTQIGQENERLAQYNRTLFGSKLHLETKERTVYGDSKSKAIAFMSQAYQSVGHSELVATGGSLYYLRHRNIIEGSENVRLEVRDKRSGRTLHSVNQAVNEDYEIKYPSGRIIFNKPVMSIANSNTTISRTILEGNLVFVVVKYEYDDQDAFPIFDEDLSDLSGGVRVSHHLNDHVRIGGTYVQEQNSDVENHQLKGIDATIKIGNFTRLDLEFAETVAESANAYVSYNGGYVYSVVSVGNEESGTAKRVNLETSIGEYIGRGRDFLAITGYWQRVSKGFSSTDTLFEEGTEKFGSSVSHKLGENDELNFYYDHALVGGATNKLAESQAEAEKTNTYISQWKHKHDKFTFTTEYQHEVKERSLKSSNLAQDETTNVIAERIDYAINDDTGVFFSQQASVDGNDQTISTAGFSTKLSDEKNLHMQGSIGSDGSSALVGIDQQIDENTSVYTNYIYSDSYTNGKSLTTTHGGNTKIGKTSALKIESQFINNDQRGTYTSNLIGYEDQVTPEFSYDVSYQRTTQKGDPNLTGAVPKDTVSLSGAYVIPDKFKTDSKIEYRVDTDDMYQFLYQGQGEIKISSDLFLLGEYEYSRAEVSGSDAATSKIDKRQVGLAYRPVKFDWFNMLLKWTKLQDVRPDGVLHPAGGFVVTDSKSDVYAGEFALDLPFNFQLVEKYAYKDEAIIATNNTQTINTPEDLRARLSVHRLNYHLTKKFDVATEYRKLEQKGAGVSNEEAGFLGEILYSLTDHFAIGAGYNFTSFDDDLAASPKNARGFFFRAQGRY